MNKEMTATTVRSALASLITAMAIQCLGATPEMLSLNSTESAKKAANAKLLHSVTCGDGLFVAVGCGGTIITSADGLTWQRRDSGTAGLLHGITYGRGKFVAVGLAGLVLTSPAGNHLETAGREKTCVVSQRHFRQRRFCGSGPLRSHSNVAEWS